MEGPHGQLGSRLSDRLCGHDSDRSPDDDKLIVSEIDPVAFLADASFSLTGEDRADADLIDRMFSQELLNVLIDHGFGRDKDLPILLHFFREELPIDLIFERLLEEDFVRIAVDGLVSHRIAVVFPYEDILCRIDEPSGEVSRLCGLQSGIRFSLPSRVGVDEVFQDREPFLIIRFDRQLDDLPGGAGNESFHSAELGDVSPVSSRTGLDHVVDMVRFVEIFRHLLLDLILDLSPCPHGLLIALFLGQESCPELLLDVLNLLFSSGNQILLRLRDDHVVFRDGKTTESRVFESDILYTIREKCRLLASVDLKAPRESPLDL